MADVPIKYSIPTATTTIINGDGSSPTLKNLSNEGRKLGIEVDPDGDTLGQFTLRCRGVSTVSSGGVVDLYFILKDDGTNYSDGGDSVAPPASSYAASFILNTVDTQQRITLYGIKLPSVPFKPLIVNRSGVAFTNTDGENELLLRTYHLKAEQPE